MLALELGFNSLEKGASTATSRIIRHLVESGDYETAKRIASRLTHSNKARFIKDLGQGLEGTAALFAGGRFGRSVSPLYVAKSMFNSPRSNPAAVMAERKLAIDAVPAGIRPKTTHYISRGPKGRARGFEFQEFVPHSVPYSDDIYNPMKNLNEGLALIKADTAISPREMGRLSDLGHENVRSHVPFGHPDWAKSVKITDPMLTGKESSRDRNRFTPRPRSTFTQQMKSEHIPFSLALSGDPRSKKLSHRSAFAQSAIPLGEQMQKWRL